MSKKTLQWQKVKVIQNSSKRRFHTHTPHTHTHARAHRHTHTHKHHTHAHTHTHTHTHTHPGGSQYTQAFPYLFVLCIRLKLIHKDVYFSQVVKQVWHRIWTNNTVVSQSLIGSDVIKGSFSFLLNTLTKLVSRTELNLKSCAEADCSSGTLSYSRPTGCKGGTGKQCSAETVGFGRWSLIIFWWVLGGTNSRTFR